MDLKPHAELTRMLRVFIKITIVVCAVAIPVGLYDYHSYSTLPPDVDANEVVLASDVLTGIVGLVQFALAIFTGITFLRWIYRSNKNLRALSGESMRFTPGWSVGWYFVPFANLVKPYQVLKEIWSVSHKDEDADSSIIGWWWGFWLCSNVTAQVAFRLVMQADDASGYALSAFTYVVSDALDLVVNVMALSMVTRIGAAYARNIVEPARPSFAQGAEDHASPQYPDDTTVWQRVNEQQKHSVLGIISFVASLVAGGLILFAFLAGAVMAMRTPGGIPEDSPLATLLGLFIIGMLLIDLTALAMAIAGLCQRGRRKVFAVLGAVISVGVAVLTAAVIAAGMMAG